MAVKKILVLGLFGVGKTSLLKKYVDGIFSDDYLVTIGVHILKKTVDIKGQSIKLIFWDTEGVEDIEDIRGSYFAGAHGFVYVCDVTRPSSYQNLEKDIKYLNEKFPGVPMLTAANKTDLLESGTINEKKMELPFIDVMVSAKEGSNVNRLFEKMAKMTLEE